MLLLLISILAGKEFDEIVASGRIVGREDEGMEHENPMYSTELRQHHYEDERISNEAKTLSI